VALDTEIEGLGLERSARERSRLQRARKMALYLFHSKTIRAYRALFLEPDGGFKPEAVLVLADLGRVAKAGYADLPTGDDAVLRDRAGKRSLWLHVLSRCDPSGAALTDLAKKIRELGHD
jgi:hypothetical protein